MGDKTRKADKAARRARSGKIYKMSELVGTSPVSFSDAVAAAVERARATLRNVDWFEVVEMRGGLHGGDLQYQVKVKVGFRLD